MSEQPLDTDQVREGDERLAPLPVNDPCSGRSSRDAATSTGQTVHFDPQRDALVALLREGVEWAERPVADANDVPLFDYWLAKAKAALDAA